MKLAVLPFNSGEGGSAPLARQLANFASEAVRASSDAEIHHVNFLTQIEQNGTPRAAMVNLAEGLVERQMLDQLFQQSEVDIVMDGLLNVGDGDRYSLQVRFHSKDEATPIFNETYIFSKDDAIGTIRTLMAEVARHCQVQWPPTPPDSTEGPAEFDLGTDSSAALLEFLEGYDAVVYIQQAQGRVVEEFSPKPAIEVLLSSVQRDKDFEGPYQGLVGLCRLCAMYQIGAFEDVENALKSLQEARPDGFEAFFGLGEVYQAIGNAPRAADQFEKAIQLEPKDSALYIRLGLSQLGAGMVVNAEKNFRKAYDLEGDDKPSTDYIAMALAQGNRAHEIPALWKALIELNPQNAVAHAKYGLSLMQAGNNDAAEKAFESALATVEDTTPVKRFYAPVLVQREEFDRAMDFYEDVLDMAPNDIPVLIEYAQTLGKAEREFEIPPVLNTVLNSSPDPNTRAQTLAWLMELEQPKRVENVQLAEEKLRNNDAAAAVRDLRPLKTWMADYWKYWALFSAALNRAGEPKEAEDAARKLLELFPGCEPGYIELNTALINQGKANEAYSLMKMAASNMQQSLMVHLQLAIAARAVGQEAEAKEIVKRLREAVGPESDFEQTFRQIEEG